MISSTTARMVLGGLSLALGLAPVAADEFEVRVIDADTKQPISVRMSIRNARGAVIRQRGVPSHGDHFCFFGKHIFKLPRGIYSYEIEKGLEYRTVTGQFEIKRGANDGVTVSIPRFSNLSARGWWSGDLSVQRPLDDLPVLMDANDLNFANFIAEDREGLAVKEGFPESQFNTVNDQLAYCQTGTLDSRSGGALVWIGLKERIHFSEDETGLPHQLSGHSPAGDPLVILRNASAWDLPVLLAESRIHPERRLHGLGLASGSQTESAARKPLESCRPVPESFPGDHRVARWQSAIYFHALNCGFQIPPVACSDSGDSPNPVGYHRVYVHTGQKFSPEQWLDNLRQGRAMVTNGPVMNVLYNGVLPGETFLVDEGGSIEIEPTLTLSLKEKAEYLEIIRNGFVAEKISLDEYAKAQGRLPRIRFTDSGWMLIRVVCSNRDTYRFAMSGPVYVQVGSRQILQPESARFFLDWIKERARMVKESSDPRKDLAVEKMRPAYEFWKERVAESGQ